MPTPSPNIWHNYFTDIVKEDYSLMETENDPAGYGVHAEVQNSLSGIHFNRQNPCVGTCVPGSSSSSTTGYSHQEAPIDPGYRQVPIAAMLPSTMRTHVEAFKNRDFADREMSSSTIRLPYIVKEVSMHLTESAVAQGLFSASQKASAHQANMLSLIHI